MSESPPQVILVVDDEPQNLQVLGRTLNSAGYRVSVSQSVSRALEKIQSLQPHLILLDIMMPEEDGFTALRKIQAHPLSKNIPVIFMTALDDTRSKVKGLSSGVVDYITKPFDVDEVLSRVKLHIDQSLKYKNLSKQHRLSAISKRQNSEPRHFFSGLPDRVFLEQCLNRVMYRQKQNVDYTYGLIIVNFEDNFEITANALSHAERHKLYQNISQRFQSRIPKETQVLVACLNNACLAILIGGLAKDFDLLSLSRKLRNQFKRSFLTSKNEIYLTTSFGAILCESSYSQDVNYRPATAIADCKIALSTAKRAKSEKIVLFSPSMRVQFHSNLTLELELRRAIAHHEFCFYYQPIVRLDDQTTVGFEALIRWQHPERGLLSPKDFITFAESTELIHNLGLWGVCTACDQIAELNSSFPGTTINVNLSAKQLRKSDFAVQLAKILEETKFPPSLLKLELTETSILDNSPTTLAQLEHIHTLGIKVCLDDFGVQYSSLSRLQEMTLDTIKIDRSFIHGMSNNSQSGEILASMIQLAKRLNIGVVAEGIENQGQLSILSQLGCEFGQGYFFSPPMPYSDIPLWLTLQVSDLTFNNSLEF
ncbi:MAG: REC domain-containing phosphodiesterase [Spirulina sp. SIO3F2]|nr:REC domain-containing phosphodiesterase [Spirulina sp. SIO3F2]